MLDKKKGKAPNEVMARMKWNLTTSAICVATENPFSHHLAQLRAEDLRRRLVNRELDCKRNLPIDYEVPIISYGKDKFDECIISREDEAQLLLQAKARLILRNYLHENRTKPYQKYSNIKNIPLN